MRHYLIDEVKRGETYARRDRIHRRDHWWWGVPTRPSCWLVGHRPELASSTYRGVPERTDYWVQCARCHCRPTLRLPDYRVKELGTGAWTPTQEWLDDLDTRAGWSAPHQAELTLTTIVPRRPQLDLAAHLHVGGLGSDTPWDIHLGVGGLDVFVGVGFGGRLADKVSGRAHSRDLRFDLSREETAHPGGLRLWWNAWTGEDMGGSTLAHRPWRAGYKRISVADVLWGKPAFERKPHGEATVDLEFDDGLNHRVQLKLEEHRRGRARQNPLTWDREWFVDWDLVHGENSHPVGTRMEDGEWVRGRVSGSGFRISKAQARSEQWVEHAIAEFRAHVSQLRAREEGRMSA